jgi:long-chain acyl-CoA synthetase
MDDLAVLAKREKLSGLEKPKEIFITDEAFTVENDLMTPTFKMKRNKVREYFEAQIKTMYDKIGF